MDEYEVRHVELRADVEGRELSGVVMPYNEEADIGGMFRERVLPGAFTESLNSRGITLTRQHTRYLHPL